MSEGAGTAKCATCGAQMAQTRRDKRYCSDGCRAAASRRRRSVRAVVLGHWGGKVLVSVEDTAELAKGDRIDISRSGD